MPASFAGAYAVTTVALGKSIAGTPESAQAARCRQIFEQQTHTAAPARGSDFYGLILQTCDTYLAFAQAARGAGPKLDQASFMGAVQRLGRIEEAAFGGGSFAPGKFDLNDDTRINRWSADCKCWKPASPFTAQ